MSLIGGDLTAPTQEAIEISCGFERRVHGVLDGRGFFVDGAFGAKGFEMTDVGFGTTALSPIRIPHRIDQVDLITLQEDYFSYCQGFNALEVTRVNNNVIDASYFGGRLHEFGNHEIANNHHPTPQTVSWSGINRQQRPWKDSFAGVGARAAAPGPGFRTRTDHGHQSPEVGDLLGADVQCTGNPFGFYHMDGSANEEGSVAGPRPISPVGDGFITVDGYPMDGNPELAYGGPIDNGSCQGPRHDP